MTQPIANPVLHPAITINYVEDAATNSRWELIWKGAATAAIVSTIALAVFGAIYSSVFFVGHFVIAALVASIVIKTYVWDRALPYETIGAFEAKIIEKMNVFEDTNLGSEIAKLGIKPGIEPARLKSILTYYHYHKGKQVALADSIKKHLNLSHIINWTEIDENKQVQDRQVNMRTYDTAALDWADKDKTEIASKIIGQHLARHKLVREAARYNLETAYALKLMESPYETRLFEDFVELSPFDSVSAFLNKAIGDRGADVYVKTKPENIEFTGERIRTFTAEELHTMDTKKLAQEIFQLPGRSWWSR